MNILEFMKDDHRSCDNQLTVAENAIIKGDMKSAKKEFDSFKNLTLHHFKMEEDILFPVFEQRTGIQSGPTQVMRMEHTQMKGLLERMEVALNDNNNDQFLGVLESLMILLQQHNMKEEQMLYPSCDKVLGGDANLVIEEMKGI